MYTINLHSFINSGLTAFPLLIIQWVHVLMNVSTSAGVSASLCIRSSVRLHHITLHHVPLMQVLVSVLFHVNMLFLYQASRSSSAVRRVHLCGVLILQHRLWAIVCVCSLQRPACSLMSVWLTSSLVQISIKAPADEAAADGCCVLGCLVCLSGSVKHLLIRKKRRPCFPAGWMLPCAAVSI